jgi:SAM-dependent methyltransferase
MTNKIDYISGGVADGKDYVDLANRYNIMTDVAAELIVQGIEVEMEHTDDPDKAREIAIDHLWESKNYYKELKRMEEKLNVKEVTAMYGTHSVVVESELKDNNYKVRLKDGRRVTVSGDKLKFDSSSVKITASNFKIGDSVDWFVGGQYAGHPGVVIDLEGVDVLVKYNDNSEHKVNVKMIKKWGGYEHYFKGYDNSILDIVGGVEEFPKHTFDVDKGVFYFESKEEKERAVKLISDFKNASNDEQPEKEIQSSIAGDNLSSQDRINLEVRDLLDRNGLARHLYTHSDFMLLSQYTGDTKTQGDKKDGYIWDYYTNDEAVKLCWRLAYKYGFRPTESTRILEPSCGVGRFLRYAPDYCSVKAFEIDETSFMISKLLYPTFDIVMDSFESMFYIKSGLKKFDYKPVHETFNLIIGNPPYMYPYTSVYKDKEKVVYPFIQSLEQMFVVRGIDSLDPNGLLIFIIPSSIVDNNNTYEDFKKYIASKANMLDLYRLPSGTFKGTDITTDIVVLQKK